MLVYLKDGSAQTIVCAATLLEVADQIISPSHSILIPDQPVPALTLEHQVSGKIANGMPMFKSLVQLRPEKTLQRKREVNSRSAALEVDALTTRPARQ